MIMAVIGESSAQSCLRGPSGLAGGWLGYSQPQVQGWLGRFPLGTWALVSGSQAFERAVGTLSWDRDHSLASGNHVLVDETSEDTAVMVSD